jgi:hypothetical protein
MVKIVELLDGLKTNWQFRNIEEGGGFPLKKGD